MNNMQENHNLILQNISNLERIVTNIFNKQENSLEHLLQNYEIIIKIILDNDFQDASILNIKGAFYQLGILTDQNYKMSFEYYLKSANLNYSFGIENVANNFRFGLGVDRNIQMTIEYYKKGCVLNNVVCLHRLARLYYYGIDINQDYIKAYALFTQAANLNHRMSMTYLDDCYRFGYGTEMNENLADYWKTKYDDLLRRP
jgi:hypothetical protein